MVVVRAFARQGSLGLEGMAKRGRRRLKEGLGTLHMGDMGGEEWLNQVPSGKGVVPSSNL